MDKLQVGDEFRAIHTFTVPAKLAEQTGVSSVGLVELTALDELGAAKRAKGDTTRLAYELSKAALAEVNGEKLSFADGSLDRVWVKLHPIIRNMVLAAYGDLHAPPEGSVDDFLKSRQVKV